MAVSYSIYNAKAKFSEVIRLAKSGKCVLVTERGTPVAEVVPYREHAETLEERIARLTREGVTSPVTVSPKTIARLKPLAHRPGAVKRFLASRD